MSKSHGKIQHDETCGDQHDSNFPHTTVLVDCEQAFTRNLLECTFRNENRSFGVLVFSKRLPNLPPLTGRLVWKSRHILILAQVKSILQISRLNQQVHRKVYLKYTVIQLWNSGISSQLWEKNMLDGYKKRQPVLWLISPPFSEFWAFKSKMLTSDSGYAASIKQIIWNCSSTDCST